MDSAHQVKLSKNVQRKLRRLQEEKEKKQLRVQVMKTLDQHKLADDKFALLHSSGTLGQEETMKEKLQRAMNYRRAGLLVPADIPLFRRRTGFQELIEENSKEVDEEELEIGVYLKQSGPSVSARNFRNKSPRGLVMTKEGAASSQVKYTRAMQSAHMSSMDTTATTEGSMGSASVVTKLISKDGQPQQRNDSLAETARWDSNFDTGATEFITEKDAFNDSARLSNGLHGEEKMVVEFPTTKEDKKRKGKLIIEIAGKGPVGQSVSGVTMQKKFKKDVSSVPEETDIHSNSKVVVRALNTSSQDFSLKEALNTEVQNGNLELRKVVVHINRPKDVEKGRENLPIVMMEQEIVEAISENDVVIVCGETGCGKTTQVPQFLYEAGYGSRLCPEKSGVVGVTQPRRVAVLATAKRVAYEMNVGLGQEVGFQVRHDRKIGERSCIKFMTDGILLRELQADFLLRKYSVIVLDEAHERSLNTDILIGMLSRSLPLRKRLLLSLADTTVLAAAAVIYAMRIYDNFCKTQQQPNLQGSSRTISDTPITPLKLVIMSATLRVEDFTSNRKMFPKPPPVIQVPARQFPVTVHFSARTELLDYVGHAHKKVCAIHRKLPPGGILVFVTGQREVEYLAKKLRKAFGPRKEREVSKAEIEDANKETDVQGVNMASITDAMDGLLDKSSEPPMAVPGMIFVVNIDFSCKHLAEDTLVSLYASYSHHQEALRKLSPSLQIMDRETMCLLNNEHSRAAEGRLGFGEKDEDDGEKEGVWTQSDSDEEAFLGDDDTLSDSDEEEVINLQSSEDVIQDTTEPSVEVVKKPTESLVMAPNACGDLVTKSDTEKERSYQTTDPGPLYVLPLYAMLPAASQLRVFAQVPEGARLVVVATNVAETSITIPGIRYVVDTGRSKERDFDRANGVSKYEVRWISKASANQRAGRAGRTGPGHCYRLYSSAVLNNIFSKFAPPEISTAPIEGVVLVMKRMGISKVVNFPFPTPPEREALVEAERCLRALSALDPNSGLLTPIGHGMAVYPISPRHARMLLAAIYASQEMEWKDHVVIAYAVAAAAALSLENPFLREAGINTEENSSTVGNQANKSTGKKRPFVANPLRELTKVTENPAKDDLTKLTEAEKLKRKQRRAAAGRAHGKFRNVHSDALSVVNALWAYEKAENRDKFCEDNFLHAKTLQEMTKLRKQLSQLLIEYSLDADAQVFKSVDIGGRSGLTKEYLLESEKAWQSLKSKTLNINQEMVLQQAICAGWADRVAHRLSAQERALLPEENGKHRKAIRYQACAVEDSVFLHPSSALAREAPDFVVYNEIIKSTRPYMWGVTGVQAKWLVTHATPLCTFSKPLVDPPPWYDPLTDKVMSWVSPSFGPHLWELPPHAFPMKTSKLRTAIFACALLQGKVVPSFSSLLINLAADPSIMVKPESHAQKRVGELLHMLGTGLKAVDTRGKLALAWKQDSRFLFAEVLAWLQNTAGSRLKNVWHRAQEEAEMDASELFPKRSKKRK